MARGEAVVEPPSVRMHVSQFMVPSELVAMELSIVEVIDSDEDEDGRHEVEASFELCREPADSLAVYTAG